jgi:hypothetical protein
MKAKTLLFLLACATCATLFAGWTAYARRPEESDKVWEYRVSMNCLPEYNLNDLGKKGWELVAVEPKGRNDCPTFYFKRAK